MSNEQIVNVLDEIDFYLRKHGKELTRDNRARAAQGVKKWRDGYKDAMAQESKKTQAANRVARADAASTTPENEALALEWLAYTNEQRRQSNAAQTTGVGLPMLEIGYGNGQITMQNAVYAATLWFAERQEAADDAKFAAAKAYQQYNEAENARANAILHQPYPATGIGRKFLDEYDVVVLTDESANWYCEHFTPDNLISTRNVQRNLAAASLDTKFLPEEIARIDAFMLANNLDIVEGSFRAAFQVLVAENIIRRTPTKMLEPTIKDPVMPKVEQRRKVERQPQGRAAEQAQREADMLADIKAAFGDVVEDISNHDSVPVEDAVLVAAYEELMRARAELSRENIRKAIFYAILKVRGQRPAHSAFTNEEVDGWVYAAEANTISAEESRRQLALWGDVKLSRVPDKTNELLKELVVKLGRKS
jgi:hypothetical protein